MPDSKSLPTHPGSGGWTKAEYDQCPELASRLHRRILDLEDALRGMLDVAGACHMVVEGPNAGWRETDMANGELGWYDEDHVPAPDCAVCAAEKRAKELLACS
jgi:hypothetical protein